LISLDFGQRDNFATSMRPVRSLESSNIPSDSMITASTNFAVQGFSRHRNTMSQMGAKQHALFLALRDALQYADR
jgi:hypothetical protein